MSEKREYSVSEQIFKPREVELANLEKCHLFLEQIGGHVGKTLADISQKNPSLTPLLLEQIADLYCLQKELCVIHTVKYQVSREKTKRKRFTLENVKRSLMDLVTMQRGRHPYPPGYIESVDSEKIASEKQRVQLRVTELQDELMSFRTELLHIRQEKKLRDQSIAELRPGRIENTIMKRIRMRKIESDLRDEVSRFGTVSGSLPKTVQKKK